MVADQKAFGLKWLLKVFISFFTDHHQLLLAKGCNVFFFVFFKLIVFGSQKVFVLKHFVLRHLLGFGGQKVLVV